MSELIDTRPPSPAPRVRVALGATLQIVAYEPVRIDIAVEDSARDGEKAQELFDRLYGFVERNLAAKIEEAQSNG